MKKYLAFLYLTIGFILVSCGGDDITPTGDPDPKPDPSFNISHMIGKKEGVVKISLLPGNNQIETEIAEVIVYQLEGVQNSLQVLFSKPEIILGGANAASFAITDKECQFLLSKYTSNNTIIEGDKIPTYIKEWFSKNDIVKIEIGEMVSEKGATYNIESGAMSMKYKAHLSIYDAGGEEAISGFSLEFEYIGLKNK